MNEIMKSFDIYFAGASLLLAKLKFQFLFIHISPQPEIEAQTGKIDEQ
jgi:hypothetical protein